MIYYEAPIEQITTHILDPIVEQICRKLLDDVGAREVVGDEIHINNSYSSSSKTTGKNGNVAKLYDNSLNCDVDYSLSPNNTEFDTFTARHTLYGPFTTEKINNSKAIIASLSPELILTEHSTVSTIKMNFRLMIRDKEKAYQVYDQFFNKFGKNDSPHTLDLYFNYRLSTTTLLIMFAMYKMWNNDSPDGFVDFMKEHSRIVDITIDRTNTTSELVIERELHGVVGKLSLSGDKPESQKKDDVPYGFNIEFSYTIQFLRPDRLILRYPIVINNVLVSEEYIPIDYYSSVLDKVASYSDDLTIAEYNNVLNQYNNDRPVIFPWYDQWKPPVTTPYGNNRQFPFFQSVVLLDFENDATTTAIDLTGSLDTGIGLSQEVLDVLLEQGEDSLYPWADIAVLVYANDCMIEPSSCTFENGIITIPNRDINKTYRLTITYKNRGTDHAISEFFRVIVADIIIS